MPEEGQQMIRVILGTQALRVRGRGTRYRGHANIAMPDGESFAIESVDLSVSREGAVVAVRDAVVSAIRELHPESKVKAFGVAWSAGA